jgi:hypothetical protein
MPQRAPRWTISELFNLRLQLRSRRIPQRPHALPVLCTAAAQTTIVARTVISLLRPLPGSSVDRAWKRVPDLSRTEGTTRMLVG